MRLFLIGISTVLLIAVSIVEADESADVARQIEQAVKRLQRLKQQRTSLLSAHRDQIDTLDRQVSRLAADADRIRARVDEAQRQVDDQQRQLQERLAEIESMRKRINSIAIGSDDAVHRTHGRIETGVPFDRQNRLRRAADAVDGLSIADAETRARALSTYLGLIGDELSYANTIALWNDAVSVEGGDRRINAYQIRVGLVGQAFVSEDRRVVGVHEATTPDEWDVTLQSAESGAWLEVLAILKAERPPYIVSVPMPGSDQ